MSGLLTPARAANALPVPPGGRGEACRGGVYTQGSPAKAMDFQEPYLRAMLGFLGLDDVTFIPGSSAT